MTDLNRIKVEVRALTIAKTFTIEGDCKLPPPPKEMLMNGLFVLLSQTNKFMDRIPLQDPKACMAILMSMETIGTLHNSLIVTFGKWYLYPIVSLHLPSIHV